MKALSKKEHWDADWRCEKAAQREVFLAPLLERFLPTGLSFCEIGCAPGNFMEYFYRRMGYTVSGIDYSSIAGVREYLDQAGVKGYTLYDGDFLEFRPGRTFDVVFSAGFVEHFDDYAAVIDLQASLVGAGGYLVIEVPNFRWLNKVLFRWLDRERFATHNLAVMDPRVLRDRVAQAGFVPLYCDYYKSAPVFFNLENAMLQRRPRLGQSMALVRKAFEVLHLDNLPNRFGSPYIVCIARRPPA